MVKLGQPIKGFGETDKKLKHLVKSKRTIKKFGGDDYINNGRITKTKSKKRKSK